MQVKIKKFGPISDLSFVSKKNSMVIITGDNATGKTTLLKILKVYNQTIEITSDINLDNQKMDFIEAIIKRINGLNREIEKLLNIQIEDLKNDNNYEISKFEEIINYLGEIVSNYLKVIFKNPIGALFNVLQNLSNIHENIEKIREEFHKIENLVNFYIVNYDNRENLLNRFAKIIYKKLIELNFKDFVKNDKFEIVIKDDKNSLYHNKENVDFSISYFNIIYGRVKYISNLNEITNAIDMIDNNIRLSFLDSELEGFLFEFEENKGNYFIKENKFIGGHSLSFDENGLKCSDDKDSNAKNNEQEREKILKLIKNLLLKMDPNLDLNKLKTNNNIFNKDNGVSLSNGLKTVLGLYFFIENASDLVLNAMFFDEIEVSLNSFSQIDLINIIIQLQKNFFSDVFITTHSPYVVSAFRKFEKQEDKNTYIFFECIDGKNFSYVSNNCLEILTRFSSTYDYIEDLKNEY